MKSILYSSFLSLVLCINPLFSAFAQPWKEVEKGLEPAAESIKRQASKAFPQAMSSENIQPLMDKLATLRTQLKALTRKRGTLIKQLVARATDGDVTGLKDQIAAFGMQMGGLSGQRTKVRQRLANLFGTKHGDMLKLKNQLSELDSTLTRLGSKKRMLESKLNTILSRTATSEQESKLDTLNSNISSLGHQIRKLEAQLDSLLMSA